MYSNNAALKEHLIFIFSALIKKNIYFLTQYIPSHYLHKFHHFNETFTFIEFRPFLPLTHFDHSIV
ncbi:hypothetical protein NBRC111894_2294 [Sporolactobacillus inulinus]|uniref:Uncharacterized protein n=1 Tax=Sporolactobacillus inulinus TaxID=2078 RepID=A0A4Y1ZCQ4_9BACL|nr:hypothetical protein NBRC111894_2294 [Sporolactobacillus inulinus]